MRVSVEPSACVSVEPGEPSVGALCVSVEPGEPTAGAVCFSRAVNVCFSRAGRADGGGGAGLSRAVGVCFSRAGRADSGRGAGLSRAVGVCFSRAERADGEGAVCLSRAVGVCFSRAGRADGGRGAGRHAAPRDAAAAALHHSAGSEPLSLPARLPAAAARQQDEPAARRSVLPPLRIQGPRHPLFMGVSCCALVYL